MEIGLQPKLTHSLGTIALTHLLKIHSFKKEYPIMVFHFIYVYACRVQVVHFLNTISHLEYAFLKKSFQFLPTVQGYTKKKCHLSKFGDMNKLPH